LGTHGSSRRVPAAPKDHHEASGVDREGREFLDEEIERRRRGELGREWGNSRGGREQA
jgi:hypothetical protein